MSASVDLKNLNLSPKQKFHALLFAIVVMGPFIYSGSLSFQRDSTFFKMIFIYLPVLYLPLLYILLKKKGPPGERLFQALVLAYFIFSVYLSVLPAGIVNVLPFRQEIRMMSIDTVSTNSRGCGSNKDKLNFVENYDFLFTLCVPKSFGDDLRPGDKLVLTGKNGLGGFLVTMYEKVRA